jgi:hypothetical protein
VIRLEDVGRKRKVLELMVVLGTGFKKKLWMTGCFGWSDMQAICHHPIG